MNTGVTRRLFLFTVFIFSGLSVFAQQRAGVAARMDARQITIGDQARLFIEAHVDASKGKLQWPVFADTFNHLEITEKGKIDTLVQGVNVTYRQRLLITGFDSGLFKIPAFQFSVIPSSGSPYLLQTDSFQLLVQTVAVDTTKEFKPIKNIIFVKAGWMDYIWYIVGSVIFIVLLVFVVIYFLRNRRAAAPAPKKPEISLQDRTLMLLTKLDEQQLWQKNQVKEYYVELTDIVRNYIEERFRTPALELTTDELLYKAQLHKELQPYLDILSVILKTADLAKFAKGQPLPQEHFDAMENARKFVDSSRPKPVLTETTTEQK